MANPNRYVRGMAVAIVETYREVLMDAWSKKATPTSPFNKYLAAQVQEQLPTTSVKYLAFEYKHWDR